MGRSQRPHDDICGRDGGARVSQRLPEVLHHTAQGACAAEADKLVPRPVAPAERYDFLQGANPNPKPGTIPHQASSPQPVQLITPGQQGRAGQDRKLGPSNDERRQPLRRPLLLRPLAIPQAHRRFRRVLGRAESGARPRYAADPLWVVRGGLHDLHGDAASLRAAGSEGAAAGWAVPRHPFGADHALRADCLLERRKAGEEAARCQVYGSLQPLHQDHQPLLPLRGGNSLAPHFCEIKLTSMVRRWSASTSTNIS